MSNGEVKLKEAMHLFDVANGEDPNHEIWKNQTYPKELLYAQRMTNCLSEFAPDASEALQLATRCQHIQRWKIPRNAFPKDKPGYHAWRNQLKVFHAEQAGNLPAHHKDPFDRMLIAQAQAEGLQLISTDEHFSKYGINLFDAIK